MLNWLLQGKTAAIKEEPFYVKTQLYNHLGSVFEAIEESNENEIQIHLDKFDKKVYQESPDMFEVLNVQKLLKPLKKDFTHFIIHGSTSDLNTSSGWSDFDSIAVIKDLPRNKKEICDLIDSCIELDIEMRKIDKLQHHGIHFLHEKEMMSYPQLYLPYQLFSNAKCLLDSTNITIKPVCSRAQEIQRFSSIVNTFKEANDKGFLNHHPLDNAFLEEDFNNTHTMYQLKYFLSVVMLLPTLWFNLRDVYCKKEDSFNLIKNHFDNKDLEILLKASKIRSDWKNSQVDENKIPNWVIETLEEKYLQRGYIFAKTLAENI